MCCFSQRVEIVSNTNIFARGSNGRQFLVYSMSYAAATDLAMVLPLPVPPNSPEDAVRFINLQGYTEFFDDAARGFPAPITLSRGFGGMKALAADAPLKVHEVGDFEASFVPRVEDFVRLDERFRIAREVWDRLPAYLDYGFAVFKLKALPGGLADLARRGLRGSRRRLLWGSREPRRVHPMAFEFPRRNPELLYFPTVHIHDRQVHPRADFDHMLYCQTDTGQEEYLQGWAESQGPASSFMDAARTQGIVLPDRPCRRRPLEGSLENKDTLIGRGGSIPAAARI
jgi:hypothetical protein